MLTIKTMTPSDLPDVRALWNRAGAEVGYSPLDDTNLDGVLLKHPKTDEDCNFVLADNGQLHGYISGCVDEKMAQGSTHGYISCVLLDREYENANNIKHLVNAVEDVFRVKGKTISAFSYKCPVRLPWIIPDTPNFQHNLMPGVPTDMPRFELLKEMGYEVCDIEGAMYRDLERFTVPEKVIEREHNAAGKGFSVCWYKEGTYYGMEEMLKALGHYRWITEIPRDCRDGKDVLIAVKENRVVGFAGPVYPEPTGRGYLAGVGVDPEFQGHGLGKILFYRLCEAERQHGAKYMSIFTEYKGKACKLYEEAGFEIKRCFAVMEKRL